MKQMKAGDKGQVNDYGVMKYVMITLQSYCL